MIVPVLTISPAASGGDSFCCARISTRNASESSGAVEHVGAGTLVDDLVALAQRHFQERQRGGEAGNPADLGPACRRSAGRAARCPAMQSARVIFHSGWWHCTISMECAIHSMDSRIAAGFLACKDKRLGRCGRRRLQLEADLRLDARLLQAGQGNRGAVVCGEYQGAVVNGAPHRPVHAVSAARCRGW